MPGLIGFFNGLLSEKNTLPFHFNINAISLFAALDVYTCM